MTLRTRLAVSLGLAAALAASLVGVIAYRTASGEVRRENDQSLDSTVRQVALVGPVILGLYGDTGRPPGGGGSFGGDDDDRPSSPGYPPFRERDLQRFLVIFTDATGRTEAANTSLSGFAIDDVVAVAQGVRRRTRGDVRIDGERFRLVAVPRSDAAGAVIVARSLAESERVVTSIRDRAALAVIGVILLGALVGALLASRITRRLKTLTSLAESIATTRQLPDAASVQGKDEVGRLGVAFGAMVEALQEARVEQHRLVQDVGHELRTPLTSLRTNVDVLQRYEALGEADRMALLGDIDAESRELSTLIDELVRLVVDPSDEADATVDLADVVDGVVARFRSRTESILTLEVTAGPHTVIGPPERINRAVRNVIDNAVKFGGGNAIEIRLDATVLSVRDHGPGVSAEDLPHVFERFHRSAAARALPGSGLGLSIVDDAMRRCSGTAQIVNHPEGGAVVTLRFPPPSGR